jgi:hypothetical protein
MRAISYCSGSRNGTRVPDTSLSGHFASGRRALTYTRWRQGTSESGDKAQGSLVYAFAVSPTLSSGLKHLIMQLRRLIVGPE